MPLHLRQPMQLLRGLQRVRENTAHGSKENESSILNKGFDSGKLYTLRKRTKQAGGIVFFRLAAYPFQSRSITPHLVFFTRLVD
jgi:hypothetical protein